MATTVDIHAAADRLTAEGKTPTLAAVRAALGGGSFTTISEAMKLWKASRPATSAAPMREAAPAAVADRLSEVAAEVWTLALDMANQRLQAEREALDVARAEAEQGRREAVEAADTIGAELDAAREQIANQAKALEASEQRGAELRGELDRLTAAHAAQAEAEHVVQAQLIEVRLRCDQLAALAEAERERTNQAAKARAAEVDQLTADRDEARAQARTAREDAANLLGRLDATQVQADALMRHMAAAKASQEQPGQQPEAPKVEGDGAVPAKPAKAPAPARTAKTKK